MVLRRCGTGGKRQGGHSDGRKDTGEILHGDGDRKGGGD